MNTPPPFDCNQDASDPDAGLMLRAGQGEVAAFEQLVEKYQYRVIATIERMLGDHFEAEDLAQKVFCKVWEKAASYRPQALFSTYLFTIVRRMVFNESRRRRRKKTFSLSLFSQEEDQEIPDEKNRPDEDLSLHELEQAIEVAMKKLSDKQRMVVILRRYDGLSYEEIASVMQMSLSAVKSHLFRARGLLKDFLSAYFDKDGKFRGGIL